MQYLEWVYNIFKFFSEKFGKTKKQKSNSLIYHPIFRHLKTYLTTTIFELDSEDPARKELFQDALIHKYTALKESMYSLATNEDLVHWDEKKLAAKVTYHINSFIKKYEESCEKARIPRIVIDKLREADKYDLKTVYMFIDSICGSGIIEENTELVHCILTALDSILKVNILRSISDLYSLNGELDGIKYKRKVLMNLGHKDG